MTLTSSLKASIRQSLPRASPTYPSDRPTTAAVQPGHGKRLSSYLHDNLLVQAIDSTMLSLCTTRVAVISQMCHPKQMGYTPQSASCLRAIALAAGRVD